MLEDVGCLPFGLSEVLLPGEERYLHLYEGRFLALFEHATRESGGTVFLGFCPDDRGTLLSWGTLAEIVTWRPLEIGLGTTIRGVRRAELKSIAADGVDKPFLVAEVRRFFDDEAPVDDDAQNKLVDLHEEVEALVNKYGLDMRGEDTSVDPRALITPEEVSSGSDERPPLRERAATLAAALGEPYANMLAFLALEAADPHVKIRSLTMSPEDRIQAALTHLQEHGKELAAKGALNSLGGAFDDDPSQQQRPW